MTRTVYVLFRDILIGRLPVRAELLTSISTVEDGSAAGLAAILLVGVAAALFVMVYLVLKRRSLKPEHYRRGRRTDSPVRRKGGPVKPKGGPARSKLRIGRERDRGRRGARPARPTPGFVVGSTWAAGGTGDSDGGDGGGD